MGDIVLWMTNNIYLIFWAIVGGIIGLTAADIDLAPPLPLRHRSAWTHGPVIPGLAMLLVSSYPGAWSFAVAFLGTYIIHLVADMFPGSWRGSALINLYPIPISLPPLLSLLYLLAGVLSAAWVGGRVMGWPVEMWVSQFLTGIL